MEESGIFLEIEIFLILLISEPKRVCKYKSMQECKYSNMHVVMNPNAQVSNHANNMELYISQIGKKSISGRHFLEDKGRHIGP